MGDKNMEEEVLIRKKKKNVSLFMILMLVLVLFLFTGTTYAFFNYIRTGSNNTIETAAIFFEYTDGTNLNITNQYPMAEENVGNANKLSFNIESHTTLTNGINFNVYATYGDTIAGKTRLLDNTIKMKFVAPNNGDGFTITNNYFATASTPTFTNNQVLIASGKVQNTQALTTKTYSLYLWLDENLAFVSSTTKRVTNAEGNPSLADATSGTTTAARYMKNDNTSTTVTLYPAKTEAQGKIIYTTNELYNSFYSIKIRVEAQNA